MANLEELRERMERAAQIEDPLDRRLWVLAVITEFLAPSGVKPILVGGAAVEFYTAGGYYTVDIDVVADTSAMSDALAQLGFEKKGRHWLREDIDIAIEAPGNNLTGDPNRISSVEIEGLKAYVIGIEDIILDRLNAYVHWKSNEDGRWALRLIKENDQNIDWPYLNDQAAEQNISDALTKLRKDGIASS